MSSFTFPIESFLYHKPGVEDLKRIESLRAEYAKTAAFVQSVVPNSAELTLSMRALKLSMTHAIESICFNPFDGEKTVDYSAAPWLAGPDEKGSPELPEKGAMPDEKDATTSEQ